MVRKDMMEQQEMTVVTQQYIEELHQVALHGLLLENSMVQLLVIILGKPFPSTGLVILLQLVLPTARSVEEVIRVLFIYISITKVLPSGHFLAVHQYQVVMIMTISVFHIT